MLKKLFRRFRRQHPRVVEVSKEEHDLCKCGCGDRVSKPGNKYIYCHAIRGNYCRPAFIKTSIKERPIKVRKLIEADLERLERLKKEKPEMTESEIERLGTW